MAKEHFWKILSKPVTFSQVSVDDQLDHITEQLQDIDQKEIIEFERELRKQLEELNNYNVLALYEALFPRAIMKKGGEVITAMDDYVSNDGFLYFRCWVLLQGSSFKEALMNNPEGLDGFAIDYTDTWAEGLLYVTSEALEEMGSEEEIDELLDVENDYDQSPYKFSGIRWTISEFETRFPVLVKRFQYKRHMIEVNDVQLPPNAN